MSRWAQVIEALACSAVVGSAVVGGAVSCSGAPAAKVAAIAAGERVDVVFADGANRLGLRNLSSVDQATYQRHGLYGASSADTKLADDGTMAALLEALTELGHFQHGGVAARADAKVTLTVVRLGRTTVWSRPPLMVEHLPELQRFDAARNAFLHVHTNIVSYHASHMTADELQRSMQEQEQRNRDAVQNILQKARGR